MKQTNKFSFPLKWLNAESYQGPFHNKIGSITPGLMHTVKEIKRGCKGKVEVELALTESVAKILSTTIRQEQDPTA